MQRQRQLEDLGTLETPEIEDMLDQLPSIDAAPTVLQHDTVDIVPLESPRGRRCPICFKPWPCGGDIGFDF